MNILRFRRGAIAATVALAGVIGSAEPLRGDVIANVQVTGRVTPPNGFTTINHQTFSLHAGSQLGKMLSVEHNPANQPANANVMPVFRTLQPMGQNLIPLAVITRTGSDGKPLNYTSNMDKGYNDNITKSSGVALTEVGNPFVGPPYTIAAAEAAVQFKKQANAKNPAQTDYLTVPQSGQMSITRAGNSPGATISSLILDPIQFGDPVIPGMVLGGGLSLSRSSFTLHMNGRGEEFAMLAQGGSDFAVSSDPSQPGPIGTSAQGLPLIYSLNLSFVSENILSPFVTLHFDPRYQFLNPDNGGLMTPADVANRLLSHLVSDGSDGVTLDVDQLDLFDYAGTAAISQSSGFSVDDALAELGFAPDLPEPGTIMLMGMGGALLGLKALVRLRSRRDRDSGSHDGAE